jgi:hypothetical protein
MKYRKAVGPDGIPAEARKCLGERGLSWLQGVCIAVKLTGKMPNEWLKVSLCLYLRTREMYRSVEIIEE